MPYQADYVLRLIEQLSGLIRGARQRLGVGTPAEPEEVAGEAISLVLGMDPHVASRLSPHTLAAMLRLGDVNEDVLPLLAEALELDAQALDAGGRAAESETRRAQAAAVRSLTRDEIRQSAGGGWRKPAERTARGSSRAMVYSGNDCQSAGGVKDQVDTRGSRAAAGRGGQWAAQERRLRLETMFRQYAPRILDYARHRGATLAEAEDVVSEVFIVLTRRLDDVPAETLPWLYGVARKVLGNQVRSAKRRHALNQRSQEAAMWASRSDQDLSSVAARNLSIRQGLSTLPDKDREALLLVAWDGLRYDEAAQALGCTHAALRQRISRARRRLLAQIDDIRTYPDTDRPTVESGEA